MNRFISIIIIKSWLTEETDHKFPNQSKRSLTVPASPGLSSSPSVIPWSDQVSLQTSHKIPTTAPQLLTLSEGTWNCGSKDRRTDKNYIWSKGGCQETTSIKREPWIAAVRAVGETLWSAFSPLLLKRALKRSRGRKETGNEGFAFPSTTNLSRPVQMDFDLEAVTQLQILSRTYDALGKGGPLEGSQAQVSNLDWSSRSGDEDVVAL